MDIVMALIGIILILIGAFMIHPGLGVMVIGYGFFRIAANSD